VFWRHRVDCQSVNGAHQPLDIWNLSNLVLKYMTEQSDHYLASLNLLTKMAQYKAFIIMGQERGSFTYLNRTRLCFKLEASFVFLPIRVC
jgi:thiamine pyrophosphokinase